MYTTVYWFLFTWDTTSFSISGINVASSCGEADPPVTADHFSIVATLFYFSVTISTSTG
jgi:hypothetical protein